MLNSLSKTWRRNCERIIRRSRKEPSDARHELKNGEESVRRAAETRKSNNRRRNRRSRRICKDGITGGRIVDSRNRKKNSRITGDDQQQKH
jgi:hypothetical protein